MAICDLVDALGGRFWGMNVGVISTFLLGGQKVPLQQAFL